MASERFEMRIDEDILMRIDAWRGEQRDVPSRSEAVRRLVDIGLGTASRSAVTLSDGEKLLFMVLSDLCEHLKVRGGEIDRDLVSSAIFGGHYWALNWKLTGLFHNYSDSEQDLRMVVDVMDMWNFIEVAYDGLSKKEKDRIEREVGPLGKHVRFTGFDGNNEIELVGIARFLVDKMNRFSRFKGRDLNSHLPLLDSYRRMLAVFEPLRVGLAGVDLTADQIVSILKARS